MTGEDVTFIRQLISDVGLKASSIISPSGESQESEICIDLFGHSFRPVPRVEWDLDDEPSSGIGRHDLAMVCNTFICSTRPETWLRNISMVTDLVLIQDLACARRGQGGAICDPGSGDVARYSVSCHGVIGENDPGFNVTDLSKIPGVIVLACVPYHSYGDGRWGKFVALLDVRGLREARSRTTTSASQAPHP